MSYEPPIVDGFTLSTSMLLLPTTYRASQLAQMETLRRANSFRLREYCVPDNQGQTIDAYSQYEYQAISLPGAYFYGLIFSVLTTGDTDTLPISEAPGQIHVQITDACTESPLFSDYNYASNFVPSTGVATQGAVRNPFLLATPMLLNAPAHLEVELYNKASVSVTCQLVLLIAEPMLTPPEMKELLRRQGIAA